MEVQRIAAFSQHAVGGNPAGVVLCDALPAEAEMQALARSVGYSETAFAAPKGPGWRVRYFSPDTEIPFCGHATIALGAAVAARYGAGSFELDTNAGAVVVEGSRHDDGGWGASLQSPPTWNKVVPAEDLDAALRGLGLTAQDLDERVPPARVHAGADHLLLMLHDRAALAAIKYDFDPFQALMRQHGWVTVALCFAESPSVLHVRNAFAYGGVYEDPATGAAAAAIAGYLRELDWPSRDIELRQGDDMGVPCRIRARAAPGKGSPVQVSGATRPCGGD
jgi:PhzF family phenazine biosynthesis protein